MSEAPAGAPSRLPLWLGAAALLALAWRFRFFCDDAYILLRYSKNLAAGHGLTFNVGDPAPVEGFSEFLWTILLAAPEFLGLATDVLAPVVTVAGSLLLLALLVRFGRDALGLGTLGLVAVALFYACNPTVAIWSTGGLSSSLSALLIFLCFRALFPGGDAEARGLEAGTFGALACLMRADGPYWIACLLGLFLASRWLGRGAFTRTLVQAGLVLVVVGGCFVAWRLATFGDYLPNTARAKVGMSALSLERGGKYLAHYLVILPVVAATFVAGLAHGARQLRRALAERASGASGPTHPTGHGLDAISIATLMAGATFAYAVLVGGDFMAMGRFFFPAIPFLALVFGALVERHGTAARVGWVAAFAASLLPIFDRHLAPLAVREALWFRWSSPAYESEFAFWKGMRDRAEEWSLIGKACDLHTTAAESLVLGPIGAVGYHSDLWIFDAYGLTNREVLEATEPASVRSTPGHDRLVDLEFFDRFEPTWKEAWLTRPGQDARGLTPAKGYAVFALPPELAEGRALVLRRWGFGAKPMGE
ncbi:MAG: hypothetical protein P1V81_08140 [Planctomycetota bacterium]|nr:hypothetical protein [Planctomycetota bacterium]